MTKHTPLTFVANTGLALTAVALLVGPLVLGQLVGSYQSGALGEATVGQGVVAGSGSLTVQTNAEEFAPYVEFDPNPVQAEGFYQTSVTLTSFTGQQAAYNGLLLLTNRGATASKLQAQVGTMSGVLDQSEVWVTMTTADGGSSTLTTEAAKVGQSQLRVGQLGAFSQGQIVIDGQILLATAAGKSLLNLAQPLTKAVGVGEKVHLGAAYYGRSATALQPTTSIVELQPGQQATLNVVVATRSGDLDTNQLVLPITITEVK